MGRQDWPGPPLFTSQLLASWAWGLGKLLGPSPPVAVPGNPPLPQAAGSDLAKLLLPSLLPPAPPLPNQTRRDLAAYLRVRGHIPGGSGIIHRGPAIRPSVPPNIQPGEGHCFCLIHPRKPPIGSWRPGVPKKEGSGLVSRTEQKMGCNNSSSPPHALQNFLLKGKPGFWPLVKCPLPPSLARGVNLLQMTDAQLQEGPGTACHGLLGESGSMALAQSPCPRGVMQGHWRRALQWAAGRARGREAAGPAPAQQRTGLWGRAEVLGPPPPHTWDSERKLGAPLF